jgi:hypothetical protein
VPVTFEHCEVACSSSMSWKSCAKKIPGLGSCEAPCVKSKFQNWDPTSWKSRLKSFQVLILEIATVKIQAPTVVTNRVGQGGQGRHPPTGPAGGPQQPSRWSSCNANVFFLLSSPAYVSMYLCIFVWLDSL